MPQKVDVSLFADHLQGSMQRSTGFIAFGSCSRRRRWISCGNRAMAILFVNSDQKDYEFDRIIMDYEQGLKDMVHYLLDDQRIPEHRLYRRYL